MVAVQYQRTWAVLGPLWGVTVEVFFMKILQNQGFHWFLVNFYDFRYISLILSLLNFLLRVCSKSLRPPTLRTYLTHFEDDDRHKNWWQACRGYKLLYKTPQLWYLALFFTKSKKCGEMKVCNSDKIELKCTKNDDFWRFFMFFDKFALSVRFLLTTTKVMSRGGIWRVCLRACESPEK